MVRVMDLYSSLTGIEGWREWEGDREIESEDQQEGEIMLAR
jgi:hypothetical protein